MRRRLVPALVAVAAAVAVVALAGAAGGGGGGGHSYTLEFDNAFGLVPGSEVRVAGVKAGLIDSMAVDTVNHHALVKVALTTSGFDTFRSDVFCESRPQSLIGEYFVDCQPGHAATVLKPGSRVPVSHTAGTVPVDLVQDMLRLPYRERLSLFIDEIGGGVAGRGQDLNAAIRRAVPALREFDQVLAILAQQNRTLADLTVNADTTVKALADNHRDVGRWIVTARNAASASATQRGAIAQTWADFPPFLQQLTPAMRSLGQVADQQRPALQNLSASAPELTRFLRDLGPFADASRPAFRALGNASQQGLKTVPPARTTVALLRQFVKPTPDASKNLAIVLNDLNDRNRATEPDPRSPTGKGFTGLEALLEYVFNQTQAVNGYDENGYILRASVFSNECSPYADAQTVRANLAKLRHCASWVGPTQPGILSPDPAGQPTPSPSKAQAAGRKTRRRGHAKRAGGGGQTAGSGAAAGGAPRSSAPSPAVPSLPALPSAGPPSALPPSATAALLGYLLGP